MTVTRKPKEELEAQADSVYRLKPINKTAICHRCYSEDKEILLEEYSQDSNFYQCPECQLIIKKSHAKNRALEGPLGRVLNGPSTAKFEVAVPRRRITVGPNASNQNTLLPTEPEVPPLANGIPDKELEDYLSDCKGILVSVTDTNTASEGDY